MVGLRRRQERGVDPELVFFEGRAARKRAPRSYEGEGGEGEAVPVPPPSQLYRHRRPRPPPGGVVPGAPPHLLADEGVPEVLRHVPEVAGAQPERFRGLGRHQRG